MQPLVLAQKYLDIFYSGKDFEKLGDIFSDDFSFRGPFYQFNSAEEYIESLKQEPPEDFKYRILYTFETETSACIIYEFTKTGIDTLMAQLFEVRGGKINKILLLFDTAAFTA